MDEKIVEHAMEIIMYAGDARLCCKKAVDCLTAGNPDEARANMKEADFKITQAHRIQTDCIQKAIAGDAFEYNILFAHAQDTLMTIYSEINLAKQVVNLFETLEERIRALEKGSRP
ncbi:MAG: PTS lactose/cellobiose transporter subunit IIA [Lacrimispora sp.]